MGAHVHYDLARYEREIRDDIAATAKTARTEFDRLQLAGIEVTVQFALFGAKMDNDCVPDEMQLQAETAIIASLIQNVAMAYGGAANVPAILSMVAEFALAGGDLVNVTPAPETPTGRA